MPSHDGRALHHSLSPTEPDDMNPPVFQSGPDGPEIVWRVGESSVVAFPTTEGWSVRVHRPEWGSQPLEFLDRFENQDDAVAWCEKIASVLTRDGIDDHLSF